MSDGNGLAEAMLGLDGFRILEVTETPDELTITVETTTVMVGCGQCGTRAEAQDRRPTDVRDLTCFGRPVRLRVLKRRWRCPAPECAAKTWTEQHAALPPRQPLLRSATSITEYRGASITHPALSPEDASPSQRAVSTSNSF